MSLSLFLTIAFWSMLPVTELRATIPFFITTQPDIPIWFIYIAAVVGNMIPNFILLWLFPRLTDWLHDHLAPRINSTVIWLHDILVQKNRMPWVYFGVPTLTIAVSTGLFWLGVTYWIWHVMVLVGIPLWSYIIYLIAHKAYRAAMEEKSIIHWFYNKVHKEHSDKFYRWGSLGLVLVVAIPLPGTGSWTGSLLAFLMGVPYWRAAGVIFLGILIAGGIVTALSTGIVSGFGLL